MASSTKRYVIIRRQTGMGVQEAHWVSGAELDGELKALQEAGVEVVNVYSAPMYAMRRLFVFGGLALAIGLVVIVIPFAVYQLFMVDHSATPVPGPTPAVSATGGPIKPGPVLVQDDEDKKKPLDVFKLISPLDVQPKEPQRAQEGIK